MDLCEIANKKYQKKLRDCSNEEIYYCLLDMIKDKTRIQTQNKSKKKLYYVCSEFLLGKLLSNNLINLGLFDEIKNTLEECGKSITDIEEIENEPSLGNGGLGRLAACFLDSIATLNLNGDGVGLLYHFGLFRQKFENNKQSEMPDSWLYNKEQLTKTNKSYTVGFNDFNLQSQMYDIDVIGYGGRINKLHLFDTDTVDDSIIKKGIEFDKRDIKRNLTLFLYPDDSDIDGKLLRIYQQYFMVSNAAQLIIEECEERGSKLYDLHEYAVIQLNDTHPTMIIPELIRILIKKGVNPNDAINTVSKCCAYTNHTILAEALEKWDLEYLQKVSTPIVEIIKELDKRIREKYTDKSVYIIKDNVVHMAHIAMHFGFSINGVAKLHTEILKHSELKNFYEIYPEKFKNMTNGITFRRWLLKANPRLTAYIESLIGNNFKRDAKELEKLDDFINDKKVLDKLIEIKQLNKLDLKNYLEKKYSLTINENSIFDIQIKRLHEYKRQQMNALYIIYKYLDIKNGNIPKTPISFIFGAKAAPAYVLAKDIIHLILCLSELIKNDPDVNEHINVYFLENYNVTLAEKLIPACDISEQISLASKEASGTGNMKLMLNGAITLGTEDGANAEIHKLVGDTNIYIFGASSNEVINRYKQNSYDAKDVYTNSKITKKCVDFITDKTLSKFGDIKNLERLQKDLMTKDWFMALSDFEDYIKVKDKAFSDYDDTYFRAKKMLVNISKAGYFSSDRTIENYNREIWKL